MIIGCRVASFGGWQRDASQARCCIRAGRIGSMKWLKRSLRYLPDDFWEAARCEYRANLELVKPRLPASVMRLATEVSLHDAKVERLRLTAACNTQLTLIAGDSDRGYIELR